MAVPQFLAGNFHYLKLASVSDVQDIIDALFTQLLLDGWTCTSGGTGISPTTMFSPARSDYARFSIVLTRNSATRLYIQMYDHNGRGLTGNPSSGNSLNLNTTPTAVYLFTGPTHMVTRAVSDSQFQGCWILDTAPHPSLLAPIPYYTSRVGGYYEALLGYQITSRSGGSIVGAYALGRAGYANVSQRFITVSGAYVFFPVDIIDFSTTLTAHLGRLPQAILVDASFTDGTELTVPIDVSSTAVFTVINNGTSNFGNLAFRKA